MSRRRPLLHDGNPNTGGGLLLLGILVVLGLVAAMVYTSGLL